VPFNVFFVLGKLVAPGDAAATAHNILASEPLYRLGAASVFASGAGYLVVTLLLYDLFKPVNRSLSLLAAFFSLLGIAAMTVSGVFQLAPLVVLGGAPYLNGFSAEQLQGLALVFLKLHGHGFTLAMLFFGFYMVLIGGLITGSSFIPRIVGLLTAISGLAYLSHSFASFLSPPLGARLFTYVMLFGVGELVLMLWLLFVGVNAAKWHEQASRSSGVRT
jgi:hypothetical protein